MGYVEQTPNAETKVELIKTLQSVTEGKVSIGGVVQDQLRHLSLAVPAMHVARSCHNSSLQVKLDPQKSKIRRAARALASRLFCS